MSLKPLIIGDLVAKLPIIQGGMGVGISLSRLAGNVALNGGIGIISTAQIGYQSPEFDENPIETNLKEIKRQVKKAKEIAKGGVIGVNIMVATKKYEEYVKAAVEAGVDLIISGAGLPTVLPKLVQGFQTKIAPVVSSVKSAKVICKLWDRKYQKVPDLVVIEGPRAGGHLGFTALEAATMTKETFDEEAKGIIALVKTFEEKYQKNIPVVYAGGVYTKEDVRHYLDLGADGVQMGTRFVTTYECDADEEYKNAYLHARKEDIQIVKSPVGMPGRAIQNKFLDEVKESRKPVSSCHQCLEHCDPLQIPYCITDALIHAAKGEVDEGLIFCGDNAYRADKLEYVADILKELSQA